MSGSIDQKITGRKTVWEHESRLFRVDELTVESDDSAPPIQWASFERGDAVAALIVNTDTNNVILVRQFRPPIAPIEGAGHQLLETVAGVVRQNEEALQCLQREIAEETGYQLNFNKKTASLAGTELISEFYSSPGGSSERIFLYYVTVDASTGKTKGGGMKEQGESIETVLIPLKDFFESLDRGVFKDPKIIVAGQWLEKRWHNRRTDGNVKQEFELTEAGHKIRGRRRTPRIFGYHIGDIGKVTDVDVWVNSSNTEFLMDTVYHRTLSARIRTLGAKTSGGVLIDDTIQRVLERRLGVGKGIDIGNVLDTVPGSLGETHNVRCLLHVASIKARILPGGVVETDTTIPELEMCVMRTLEKCDKLNARWFSIGRWVRPYRSVLLPLFGAGEDRNRSELKTQDICDALIPAVVRYFEEHPNSRVEKVYFLAYTPFEVEICDSVMSRTNGLHRVSPRSASGTRTGTVAGLLTSAEARA